MDIKELNEAIGRVLNETSDTTVKAVADKRKDAFDKKSMKEDEGFKVGDFVFSRAHFRYGYIKDFDGRLYTVEFVCSVYGAEEMATTDSVAPAYLEDGNIRLDSEIADLERQLAAQKKIKEKFANKVTNEAVTDKKSMKEEKESFETVLIDDRYLIYPDGVVYDTEEAKDIPSYVFKIRDKIIG